MSATLSSPATVDAPVADRTPISSRPLLTMMASWREQGGCGGLTPLSLVSW